MHQRARQTVPYSQSSHFSQGDRWRRGTGITRKGERGRKGELGQESRGGDSYWDESMDSQVNTTGVGQAGPSPQGDWWSWGSNNSKPAMGIRTWGSILEEGTADAHALGWEHVGGAVRGTQKTLCWPVDMNKEEDMRAVISDSFSP